MGDPEKMRKTMEMLSADVSYCEKIINDLLDYSRDIKVFPSKTSVKNLLSMSLNYVQIPENIHINDLTENDVEVKVDKEKIVRVFDNIIKNAIDAMPGGGTLMIKSEISNDTVHVSFADTGLGIPKENLEKLFTPLFTTKAQGMGLGLPICKRIIGAHGGTISVESIPDKGTTFRLQIPVDSRSDKDPVNDRKSHRSSNAPTLGEG